jgi:hypothetical protein
MAAAGLRPAPPIEDAKGAPTLQWLAEMEAIAGVIGSDPLATCCREIRADLHQLAAAADALALTVRGPRDFNDPALCLAKDLALNVVDDALAKVGFQKERTE